MYCLQSDFDVWVTSGQGIFETVLLIALVCLTRAVAGVWAVVNCAESYAVAEVDWFSPDDFNQIMQVNFLGTVRVTKALLPLLRKAKGRVVNLSNISGEYLRPCAYKQMLPWCLVQCRLISQLHPFSEGIQAISTLIYYTANTLPQFIAKGCEFEKASALKRSMSLHYAVAFLLVRRESITINESTCICAVSYLLVFCKYV